MASGGLVPDELVIELVRRRLLRGDLGESRGGYVMDGYPRTRSQAEALSAVACSSEKAIFIEVSENEAVDRLLSRLTCRDCGAIYNLRSKPPSPAGVCAVCGGSVERRADDNEEAVRQRFRVYAERTLPVIDYYDKSGLLARVDGSGDAALVYDRLKGLVA
jgi:adenylate kinase